VPIQGQARFLESSPGTLEPKKRPPTPQQPLTPAASSTGTTHAKSSVSTLLHSIPQITKNFHHSIVSCFNKKKLIPGHRERLEFVFI